MVSAYSNNYKTKMTVLIDELELEISINLRTRRRRCTAAELAQRGSWAIAAALFSCVVLACASARLLTFTSRVSYRRVIRDKYLSAWPVGLGAAARAHHLLRLTVVHITVVQAVRHITVVDVGSSLRVVVLVPQIRQEARATVEAAGRRGEVGAPSDGVGCRKTWRGWSDGRRRGVLF